MVVTEQCLLSHTRNPHLGREGIERELKVHLPPSALSALTWALGVPRHTALAWMSRSREHNHREAIVLNGSRQCAGSSRLRPF